jgi:hypothetical protein
MLFANSFNDPALCAGIYRQGSTLVQQAKKHALGKYVNAGINQRREEWYPIVSWKVNLKWTTHNLQHRIRNFWPRHMTQNQLPVQKWAKL